MTSTFTPSIGLEQPARGDYKNTWDVPCNANWGAIDAKLGGTTTLAAGTSTIVLTKAQAQAAMIVITGNLSAPIAVQIPAGMAGPYYVLNGTTGNQPIVLQTTAGGAALQIGPGIRTLVLSDGTNVFLADQSGTPPGTILPYGGPVAPSGFLFPYGQLIQRSAYAGLFAAFGTTYGAGDGSTTFGMPDYRGCTLAGLDNMGGTPRGLLTSFGSSGQQLGAQGGEQTHTLSVAELAAHNHGLNDGGHAHATNESPHSHQYGNPNTAGTSIGTGVGGQQVSSSNPGNSVTSPASTGLTVSAETTGITVQNAGSGSAHNNVQPTVLCNWIVKT